jgi:protein-S-isoprenylcysteine O-methyltransferase Ste14
LVSNRPGSYAAREAAPHALVVAALALVGLYAGWHPPLVGVVPEAAAMVIFAMILAGAGHWRLPDF